LFDNYQTDFKVFKSNDCLTIVKQPYDKKYILVVAHYKTMPKPISKPIRKKEVIGATVSPWVKSEALKLVETGEFSSLSDLVGVAITKFVTEHNTKKQEHSEKIELDKTIKALEEFIKTDEGRKTVEQLLNKTLNESKEPESRDSPKKPEEHPGNKAQVLFGGDPEDYPQHHILE
jgi:Arc/MetJ-type ribon-helix-helix transcriptional regulator